LFSLLASNTKKREEKRSTTSSLGVFLNIVVAFVFASGFVVPRPRVFHSWRMKRWIDDWLGGLKTHRHVHLALALLVTEPPQK
jgi:thiosulfate reductase cytochrome b subunit